MSRRKERPPLGSDVTEKMSLRDAAGCLGTTKSELHRWCQLAALPEAEFERRLASRLKAMGAGAARTVTASTMLFDERQPVPPKGQVQRALALFIGMSKQEQSEFIARVEDMQRLERAW